MSCVICCESLLEHIGAQSTAVSSHNGANGMAMTDSDAHTRSDWQTQPSVLCCGHVFHQGCISAWLAHSTRKSCPTCRKRQTGDPIAIYFEVEPQPGPGSGDQTTPTISQLQHRNHMIRTLCTNVEQAQSDASKAREELGVVRKQYAEKCSEHHIETIKGKTLRERIVGSKKVIADLKVVNMKLDKTVAEQARQIEALSAQLETTRAELVEQKRVVANMGDVRATNENLARSLKKEKTRNETLATLNAQLASKVSSLENSCTGNDRACLNAAEGCPLDTGRLEGERHEGPAHEQTNTSTCHVINDTDSDLQEDATAISNSIAEQRTRAGTSAGAQPSTRLASTFELPLAAIHTAEPKSAKNPFAIASSARNDFGPSEFLFSLSLDSIDLTRKSIPVGSSLGGTHFATHSKSSLQKPSNAAVSSLSLKYPSSPMVSDGMGGSRRKGSIKNSRGGRDAKGKRSTGTIQAKINWSFKKQD
ncbi:hypothetical protein GGF40_001577 [Coemansia sp. RSA 1286]|nr:hypothetical protein IWW45_006610 [Coemansia sp. RSA 485]KAJ2601271.1 hypothetical protein GGF39_001339 [Coemansia sp. RSA 1721]KAJ2638538.1 hypothetical protein GGF40_001577 [Coemansia sp. RSA 1286]